MNPDVPVDDNKYTVGLAVSACLPIICFASELLILILSIPWAPWLPALLLILTPPLTTFAILYFGPWQHNWSQPKRILLGSLLSLIIVAADGMLTFYCIAIFCLAFPNLAFSPPSQAQY
jgi:hypothetical protein